MHLPLRWALNTNAWTPTQCQLEVLLRALGEADRQRCLRYKQPDDQKRALVSCVLQRACIAGVLADHGGGGVTGWAPSIKRTQGGKPFYAGPATRPDAPNFNFNVSHEGDFVVLACEGHCLCGVDVAAPQQLRVGTKPLLEVLELMRPQLTANEWVRIQSHAGDEATMEATFQALWSCKEAFIKARGDGVAFELSQVEVQLPACTQQDWAAQPVQRATLVVDGQPAPAWRAFLQRLPNRHWAAVVRGPPDAAVDAFGEFTATLRQRAIEAQQLQQLLDAPSPVFDLLDLEDLLPEELLRQYKEAGGG